MINTILVPVDVSQAEAGGSAVALAQDMAAKYGGKLVLLYVMADVPGFVKAQLPEGVHAKALAAASVSLDEFVKQQGLPGGVERVVREGAPAPAILDYSEKINADMIVIASHDPGFADYFLGSVAARVVRHAHCSVLVARQRPG